MATLDDYQNLLNQHTNENNAQVRIKHDGTLTLRTTGEKFTGLFSGSPKNQNDQVLVDFKTVLTNAYGADATNKAFAQAGLTAKENTHSPLTLHRMKDAMNFACNELALSKDQDYKQQYTQREDHANDWVPNTVASTLTEDNNPGLRCHTIESQDMCVHGWHPCNHEDTGFSELDNAVRNEMNNLPTLNDQPRLQNLQARLNLLEKMVTQAENSNVHGKTNVFTAPEWLFTAMEGQNINGQPISGGCLTETEMKQVTLALNDMSERHPDTVIMPGTILWSKPIDNPIDSNGQKIPGDMVFNTAPVLSEGKLLHTTFKNFDGGDSKCASKGINDGGPYEKPSVSNGASSRVQVFMNDRDNKVPGVSNIQNDMKQMMQQPRDWEVQLGLRPQNVVQQNSNHMFKANGKTFAVDICADHAEKQAFNEYKGNGPSMQPGSIGHEVQQNGGVDGHIVIAAGRNISNASCISKQDGIVALNDLNTGMMKMQTVTGSIVTPNGNVPKLSAPTNRDRTLASDQLPHKVGQQVNVEQKNSQNQQIKLGSSGNVKI